MTACPHCNASIVPGMRFCSQCGQDTSAEQQLMTTASVPPFGATSITQIAEAEMVSALRHATVGEYDVQGELGRGGMAIVYLAHDIALHREVAIKVMSPTLITGAGMVERFKREARTAASLSHPHIIPIYAVKETDRILFFVMKYVAGRPLDSVIDLVGQLPIPMVTTILSQVGGALGYAHREGVVHRDIKPANIIIDREGWAVVTDFGIAKIADAAHLTASGAAVGTPTYMSPEQCSGHGITGASDQYSLGILAYQMIAGQQPFTGDSVIEIMKKHFFDEPEPIENLRPDCPTLVRTVVHKMLAKDPEDRFPSLEAMVNALGATPLASDDPVRIQIVELARSGAAEGKVSSLSTPKSPFPLSQSPASETPSTPAPGLGVRPSADTEVVPESQPDLIRSTAPGGPTGENAHETSKLKLALIALPLVVTAAGLGAWGAVKVLQGGEDVGAVDAVANTTRTLVAGGPDSVGLGGTAAAPLAASGDLQTDAEAGAGEPPQQVAEPLVTIGTVRLSNLPPGAQVTVDGEPRSGSRFRLDAGDHAIRITSSGWDTFTRRVRLDAAADITVAYVGSPIEPVDQPSTSGPGILQVQLRPAADLVVDGISMGLQFRYREELRAGVAHIIEVRREGFVPWDTTLTLQTGQTVTLRPQLQPRNEGGRR